MPHEYTVWVLSRTCNQDLLSLMYIGKVLRERGLCWNKRRPNDVQTQLYLSEPLEQAVSFLAAALVIRPTGLAAPTALAPDVDGKGRKSGRRGGGGHIGSTWEFIL